MHNNITRILIYLLRSSLNASSINHIIWCTDLAISNDMSASSATQQPWSSYILVLLGLYQI